MGSTKDISVSIDIDALDKQLDKRRQEEDPTTNEIEVRSTVFSLGKDPRVQSQPQVSTPDLYLIEILKDGIDNPYVELHWKVARYDIDVAGIIGFNVYRRRFSKLDLDETMPSFSRAGFDRISRKTIQKGNFSQERKAIPNIRRSLIPGNILNNNLSVLQQDAIKRNETFLGRSVWNRVNSGLNEPTALSVQSQINDLVAGRKIEKVAYVDCAEFLEEGKKKFLRVINRESIDLLYRDKKVGYGEVFEYYITSVTKDFQESVRSNSIEVTIEDLSGVNAPYQLTAKQLSENEIQVRACVLAKDNIGRMLVYRKAENEIAFERVASVENVNDSITIIDGTVNYGKSYTYRIFAQNIYGTISQPTEIKVVSSVQKITPQSRSNNLKIPVLSVVQDQNSNYIKVIMHSNDPLVSFFVLERRDLTTHDRDFSVPGRDSNYGGTGWKSNKFFVNKSRSIFDVKISTSRDFLNKRAAGSEIVFLDNTVAANHIYQYRVYGSDLFGNISPYALNLIKATGKKSLRTPINLRSEILRGNPFRVQISWEDDNLVNLYTQSELRTRTADTTNKYLYKIQRRRLGEIVYETFPLTANTFLIDEENALDALMLTLQKTEDNASKKQNSDNKDGSIILSEKGKRPFGVPAFLNENDIYYYRVAAVSEVGEESNYTKEFEVSTISELSDPLMFKAEVLNTKIRPLICRLSWTIDPVKRAGDYFVIERKVDSLYDTFECIGKSYFDLEFFDRNIKPGYTYIYRIKSVDALNRESKYFIARLTI